MQRRLCRRRRTRNYPVNLFFDWQKYISRDEEAAVYTIEYDDENAKFLTGAGMDPVARVCNRQTLDFRLVGLEARRTGLLGPEARRNSFQRVDTAEGDDRTSEAQQRISCLEQGKRLKSVEDGMWKLGDSGAAVRSIKEMLNFLGFKEKKQVRGKTILAPLELSGAFDEAMESVIFDFQRSEGILADGIVGPQTVRSLETTYTARRLELDSPGPDAFVPKGERFVLERVPAEQWNNDGYSRVNLRADVATAYREARAEVLKHGAILTSSGGIRGLGVTVSSSRSATSFHYTGRAFDLFIYSGMVDPEADAYVMERVAERRFRVWARCFATDDGSADVPSETTIQNVVSYDDRSGSTAVTGNFIDLTSILDGHGFKPIRARRGFFEGRSMMAAGWWHFQWEEGLVSGHSTFGSELLKLYRHETLEGTPPWKSRDRVFGLDWN